MKVFGLIGYPLTHSFSQRYFENKFNHLPLNDCVYNLFEMASLDDLVEFKSNHPLLKGLNVTIPYKEKVIPLLDGISDTAASIGAVNTIKILNDKWYGFNTDVDGFKGSLQPLLNNFKNQALILGTGGASKAVQFVLNQLSIPFTLVSRNKHNNSILYTEINAFLFENIGLIINTTPLGMYPNMNELPDLPIQYLNHSHLVYDLIYNPEETLLLKLAKQMGCRTKNGYEMLTIQAEKSWELWNE